MRTHTRWLYLAPLLSAAPFALVHCSSTPASPSKSNDGGLNSASGSGSGGLSGSASGGSSSGVTSGSSGGNNGGGNPVVDGSASSSGGASDGGDGSAGPPACVSVDGGAQCSAPLMLPCGSSTCNTSSSYCCIDTADGGGAPTCVAPNGSCSPMATKISCKEAADCANGALCCGNFPMLGVQGNTSCLASCNGNQNVQICRTDSECGGNADGGGPQKCVLQTCGSLTLQLCAASGGGFGGPQPDAGGAYPGCTAK